MYRYIGNKAKLTPYILDKVQQMIGDTGTVADIMAGTGTVSLELRKKGYKVVASDVMTYSYHHLNVNLCMKKPPEFLGLKDIITDDSQCMYESVLKYLNCIEPKKSFFYREFSPEGTPRNGTPSRKYFTSENAMRIDAIREKINEWIDDKLINKSEESLLKHTLIMAVNEVANISGTYGYFLSSFKKNSLERLELKPVDFYDDNNEGHVIKLSVESIMLRLIRLLRQVLQVSRIGQERLEIKYHWFSKRVGLVPLFIQNLRLEQRHRMIRSKSRRLIVSVFMKHLKSWDGFMFLICQNSRGRIRMSKLRLQY